MQKGRFLRFLAPLLKSRLSLLKSVIRYAWAYCSCISHRCCNKQKKILGSGTTTLAISNDEMKDILKIVKSLEDSGMLLKGVSETIKDKAKEQKGGFLSALLGSLGASLSGDMLFKKGKRVIRAGEGTIRASYGSNRSSLKKFSFHHIL